MSSLDKGLSTLSNEPSAEGSPDVDLSFDLALGQMLVEIPAPMDSDATSVALRDVVTDDTLADLAAPPQVNQEPSVDETDSTLALRATDSVDRFISNRQSMANTIGTPIRDLGLPNVSSQPNHPQQQGHIPLNDANAVFPSQMATPVDLQGAPIENESIINEGRSNLNRLIPQATGVQSTEVSMEQPNSQPLPTEIVRPGETDSDLEVRIQARADNPISDESLPVKEFSNLNSDADDTQSMPRDSSRPFQTAQNVDESVTAFDTVQAESIRANQRTGSEIRLSEAKMVDQISERIRVDEQTTNTRKQTTIEIELDPPELGRARVELTDTENGVSAKIVMTREASARIVESNLDALRESLRESGVDVSEFDVSYEDPSSQRQEDFEGDAERSLLQNSLSSPSVVPTPAPIRNNRLDSNRQIDLIV